MWLFIMAIIPTTEAKEKTKGVVLPQNLMAGSVTNKHTPLVNPIYL